MNCADARRLIGSDPAAHPDAALDEHLRGCEACRRLRDEMLALEGAIRRALHVDLSAVAAPSDVSPAATSQPRRRPLLPWALVASLVVALAAGVSLWVARPANALASDVVAHAEGEPASWSSVAPVPSADVDAILRRAGVTLAASAPDVVYARTCEFRGREIPHLVVLTTEGPVTVLVLRNERVAFRHGFSEEGYTGVLVPAGDGSIAVLAQGTRQVDEAARVVMGALQWADPGELNRS